MAILNVGSNFGHSRFWWKWKSGNKYQVTSKYQVLGDKYHISIQVSASKYGIAGIRLLALLKTEKGKKYWYFTRHKEVHCVIWKNDINNNTNPFCNNNNNNNVSFKECQINFYWSHLNPIWTATKREPQQQY